MAEGSGSNGWQSLRWTLIGAFIIAIVTGGVAFWRQFTVMEERQEYLLQATKDNAALIATWKEAVQALQQQTALLGHTDAHIYKKLQEHEDFLREILPRLRAVEQRRGDH